MADLVLDASRAALCIVEMQNDIVHESNIGNRGMGGVLAAQVQKRGVITKLQKSMLQKDVDTLQPHVRAFVERAVTFRPCPDCGGQVPLIPLRHLADLGDLISGKPTAEPAHEFHTDPGHHHTCSHRDCQ